MVSVAAPAPPKVATRSVLILAGIACGACFWGTYGILEYVFTRWPWLGAKIQS